MSDRSATTRPVGVRAGQTTPLSPGLIVGDLVFVSGMTALDPDHPTDLDLVPDDFAGQFVRTMSAIEEILREAGVGLRDVVSVRAYLPCVERDFADFNLLYRQWFVTEPMPTRTTTGVTLAIPKLLVEIDVVARSARRL
jgi:2-iminobutanoate/2-iminopropanoate deaminase